MKKIILLLCVLYLPIVITAQNAYEKGTVITLNKDTLRGEIYTDVFAEKYIACKFRKDGKIRKYKPSEILQYKIEDERVFLSGIVKDQFVELLVGGKLSLYSDANQFYLQKDNRVHSIKRLKKVNRDGFDVNIEDKTWRGKVFALVRDRLADKYKPSRLKYHEKYLINLTQEYNGYNNVLHRVRKEKKNTMKLKLGVVAGVNFESVKINTYGSQLELLHSYKANVQVPFVGLKIGARDPKWSRRLNFEAEFLLSKLKLDNSDWDFILPTQEVKLDYTKLNIPASVKYTYPLGKINASLHLGIFADLNISGKYSVNYWRITDELDFFQIGAWTGLEFSRNYKNYRIGIAAKYYRISEVQFRSSVSIRERRLGLSLFLDF